METITAEELKQLLDRDPNVTLLDVREPWEYDICRIPGSINIPMSEIPGRLDELDQDGATIVICHHGARSLQVAGYMEATGFDGVVNLDDGIAGWARTIDPDMPQY